MTNGVSDGLQKKQTKPIRCELYAVTQDQAPWVVDLLSGLAQYPFQNETYFSVFDTVDAGQPLDRKSSAFTSILLIPPGKSESQTLTPFACPGFDSIDLFQVIGIDDRECDLAIEKGGEALWAILQQISSEICIDRARKSSV